MKTPPLRITIAVLYIALVLATSVLVVYLTFISGRRDVASLALSLHSQTYARVVSLVDNLLSLPQNINRVNLSYIESGVVDINNSEVFKKHLLSQFVNYPSIISMEYGDEDKNNFGPARNIFDAPLSFGESGKDTGYVYRLYQVDTNGSRGKILWEQKDYNPKEKSWYKEAISADEPSWTPIYLWPNGDVGIDAITPVKVEGKIRGVLDAAITLKEISAYLKSINLTPGSQIFIIERSGLMVTGSTPQSFDSYGTSDLKRTNISESEIEDLKNIVNYLRSNKIDLKDITNEQQFIVDNHERHYTTIAPYSDNYGLDWLIILSSPESEIMTNLNQNSKTTIIVITIAVILSVIIALCLAWWITNPVTKLSKYAELLSKGDWDQKIDISRTDEIGVLAKSFSSMSSQLKQKNLSMEEYSRIISSEKQKLEAVLKSMADSVCVTDIQQDIILVNNSFARLTSMSMDQLKKLSFDSFIKKNIPLTEDRKKLSDLTDLLFSKSGGVVSLNSILIRSASKKETIVDVMGSKLLRDDGGAIGMVIVLRDVTKQVEFEKMKEGFVSLASHQLRTPLTGIKWSASLVQKNKTLPKRIMSLINQIYLSNEKMISLVNGLLTVSKIESGKEDNPTREKVSIKEILAESANEESSVFKENNIKLIGLTKISPSEKIFAHKEQLVQVFDNLLNNAAIYSKNGGTVSLSVVRRDNKAVISVSDQGFGIPKDQVDKVFGKFYRASNVANKIPGTGLGLYYVKQVVERHNGQIWFKTEENKGTTFYIELPAA